MSPQVYGMKQTFITPVSLLTRLAFLSRCSSTICRFYAAAYVFSVIILYHQLYRLSCRHMFVIV